MGTGKMFKILLAEDDTNTRKLMAAMLRMNGYEVITASDGKEALELFDQHHIDLLVVDVMMPNMNGFTLTQALRDSDYNLPILMVTAKQMPEDKRRGFIVGTDDYMTKPVDKDEMLLRIKALLRRSKIVNDHKIVIGKLVLDYDSLTVSREENVCTLPPKEFYLLYKLLAYPGQVFTRLQLLDEIWGLGTESEDNTVNVHINRLRNRFEGYPEFEIQTVRGLGYRAVKKDV